MNMNDMNREQLQKLAEAVYGMPLENSAETVLKETNVLTADK